MMMLVAVRALGDYNTVPYEHVPKVYEVGFWKRAKNSMIIICNKPRGSDSDLTLETTIIGVAGHPV
jgi:hypothetical protein